MALFLVSDRVSRGDRDDLSGPAIASFFANHFISVVETAIVPDDIPRIQGQIVEWSNRSIPIIISSGGTGFAPSDVTPEVSPVECLRY